MVGGIQHKNKMAEGDGEGQAVQHMETRKQRKKRGDGTNCTLPGQPHSDLPSHAPPPYSTHCGTPWTLYSWQV